MKKGVLEWYLDVKGRLRESKTTTETSAKTLASLQNKICFRDYFISFAYHVMINFTFQWIGTNGFEGKIEIENEEVIVVCSCFRQNLIRVTWPRGDTKFPFDF